MPHSQPPHIPCSIGKVSISRALVDLGASVSLMPLSIYRKINLGEMEPTAMTLQLADRSVKHPVGIVDDLPVVVRGLCVPVDFVIMDMPEDGHTPIILGRPFMATTGVLIDVKQGKLSLNVGEQKVVFDLKKSMKFPPEESRCHLLELEEEKIFEEGAEELLSNDPLQEFLEIDEPLVLGDDGFEEPMPPLSYPPGFACVANKKGKQKGTFIPDPGGKPKILKKAEHKDPTKKEPPDPKIKREVETVLFEPQPIAGATGMGEAPDLGLQHFRPP